MANGSKRKRGNDEYVFVDGRAMRADEVVRIDVGDSDDTVVPGQNETVMAPGQEEATKGRSRRRGNRAAARPADAARGEEEGAMRRGLRGLEDDEPFALTPEAERGEFPIGRSSDLMDEERHRVRNRYLVTGIVLIAVAIFSLCMSPTLLGTFHSPLDVIKSIGAWFRLTYTYIFQSEMYVSVHREVVAAMPYYSDCMLAIWDTFKYVVCGALLAVSGMLFQNTFRNPIAAPSMLGISNGVNFGLFFLVMQFGYQATQHIDLYYLYSFIGGIAVLLLVMVGGSWVSGPHRFNVVNMILIGTVVSQLLGVILTYAEAYLMDEQSWDAYYLMQNATTITTTATYLVLIIGSIISIIPIFAFRFGLNLVSFSDDESRLIGANPNRLRILTLGCGTLMMLVAQTTVGQVSMAGLMIPFVVRAIFGSEFRKQLGGNLILGALVLLVCSDVGTLITIDGISVGASMIVNIIAIPMFIWMLAIRQRSWD